MYSGSGIPDCEKELIESEGIDMSFVFTDESEQTERTGHTEHETSGAETPAKNSRDSSSIAYDRVITDMNKEAKYQGGSIILTGRYLYVIRYAQSGQTSKKKTKKSPRRSEFGQRVISGAEYAPSFDKYPVEEIESLGVDEVLSYCRLFAVVKGERVLVTCSSFYSKDDFYNLCAVFSKIKDGREGEIDPDKKQKFCPKCGRRYPDPDRRFCPDCMDRVKIVKRMSVFFLKYKWYMAAIIATTLALSAFSVIAPYLSSKVLYDEVLNVDGKYAGRLLFIITLIFTMRIARLLVQMLNNYVSSWVSAKVVYDIKKLIFSSIERLSMGYFTSRTTGGLMNQVYHDANRIYWFFTDGAPYFVINIVQLLTVTVIMISYNPLLTVIALGLCPLVFFLIGKLFRKSRKLNHRRYIRSRALNALLSDLLTGIRIVKTFSREKGEAQRFSESSKALAGADMRRSRFGATAYPLVNTLVYLGIIFVWGFGGWMAIKGGFGMTYGVLTLFLSYVNMVYSPLYFFVDMVEWSSDAMNSMNRLFEVTDAVVDVVEKDDPVVKDSLYGNVRFENVDFSYTKNKKVIDNVSFDVPAGNTVGIVGHTGSGKSTLANLLIRLYDADDGRITIDGVNVKDYSFDTLRKNVSIVSQETYLFVGTIYDNIRYANEDATKEQVIEAAKAAGAHDFIIKLPDAYSTMVGFGHKDLSGGEKQRISIARALLRNPRILILDEATAAMDTQTERRIQATLDSLSKGRTTIMIAHRLSTLKNADSLVVISNGKVIERGTHAELLAQKNEYYKLYRLQLEALKNVGVTE